MAIETHVNGIKCVRRSHIGLDIEP